MPIAVARAHRTLTGAIHDGVRVPLPLRLAGRTRWAVGVLALLAFALLAPALTAPAKAQTTITLISNTGQTSSSSGGSPYDHAQAFTTGANAAGYKLTSVNVHIFAGARDNASSWDMKVCNDSSGSPGSTCTTLTKPGTLTTEVNTFTAPGTGMDLAASTTYHVVMDITAAISGQVIDNTTSDNEDSGGATGWSIADSSRYRGWSSTGSWQSFGESRRIAIRGYAKSSTTVSPPTLGTSVLSRISYALTLRERPGGTSAWRESYALKSGSGLTGFISPGTVTCAAGTAEIGWYKSDALTTRLGNYTSIGGGIHTLGYIPTGTGEFRALAYCKSGTTYSTAVSLMRGGAVTLTPPPTLSVDMRTPAGARLTLTNHATAWSYRQAAPRGVICVPVSAGTTTANLAILTANTSYTYKAYSNSTCSSANVLASVTFTTHAATLAPITGFTAWNEGTINLPDGRPIWHFHRLEWNTVPHANHFYLRSKRSGVTGSTNCATELAGIPWTLFGITNPYPGGFGVEHVGGKSRFKYPFRNLRDDRRGSTGYACYQVEARNGTSRGTSPALHLKFGNPPADHGSGRITAINGTAVGGQLDPGAGAASVTLAVSPNPVEEGLPVRVTATLSAALSEAVSIPLTVTPGTSEETDHGTLPAIDIAAGATTGTASMTTAQDLDGDDETFTVALDTDRLPSSVTAGDPASATVTIDDTVTGESGALVMFPDPPAILEAEAGDEQVTLRWSAVAGATGWEVERDGSGVWSDAGDAGATSHTVTGLTNGTEYSFKVRATKLGVLEGTASASVSATPSLQTQRQTVSPPPEPAAPPDPVAAVTVTHNGSSLEVSWDAPTGATHYDVTYSGNGANARAAWNRAGTNLTITCDVRAGYENQHCVTSGATYTVGVRARNAAGESAWVNSAPAQPPQAPSAPGPVAAVRVTHQGSSLAVSWDAPTGATAYDVTYTDTGSGESARAAWNRAGTSLTITCDSRTGYENQHCVTSGATYTVGVRARNAGGESAWVNSAPAQPPQAQQAPQTEQAPGQTEQAPGQATIWVAAPGAGKVDLFVVRPVRTTGYEVRTKTGGGSECAAGTWGAEAAVPHRHVSEYEADQVTLTGLAGGTSYCIQVRATNASPTKGDWSAAVTATTPESALGVADATANEPGVGESAALDFVVTLTPASSGTVTVAYATSDGTATAASDYTGTSGTLTFAAGETSKTVSVPVLADAHDDGGETLTLALSNASGARIADAEATGTIANDGHVPKAWTARFGRAVADQVTEAVQARMRAGTEPVAEAALAGERIGPRDGTGDDAEREQARREAEVRHEAERLAAWLAGGDMAAPEPESRATAAEDLLAGSSFTLASRTASGGLAAFWGRGAVTRFDGREGEMALDGEVATAMLGADWTPGASGRTRLGIVVSRSAGDGPYSGPDGSGAVKATLTGAFPWAGASLGDGAEAWALAGLGSGGITVTPKGQEAINANLRLRMAAAGIRGTLLDGGAHGLTLAARTDAMAVRTSTGRGSGPGGTLAASEATATRLRLGLEASRPVAMPGGGTLTPSLEIGARHDGGDAETGFGIDLGGAVAFSDPGSGLEAEIRARGLLSHEADGFRERGVSGSLSWRQRPGTDRGAVLSLKQDLGATSSGGAEALIGPAALRSVAADGGNGERSGREAWRAAASLAWGLPAFGNRFTLTPEAGAALTDAGRDWRLGLRLAPRDDPDPLSLALEAARRESGAEPSAEHEIGFRIEARW